MAVPSFVAGGTTSGGSTSVTPGYPAIAAEANLHDEPYRAQIPFGWLEFYYRVRWTGTHGQEPISRLGFKLEECMR